MVSLLLKIMFKKIFLCLGLLGVTVHSAELQSFGEYAQTQVETKVLNKVDHSELSMFCSEFGEEQSKDSAQDCACLVLNTCIDPYWLDDEIYNMRKIGGCTLSFANLNYILLGKVLSNIVLNGFNREQSSDYLNLDALFNEAKKSLLKVIADDPVWENVLAERTEKVMAWCQKTDFLGGVMQALKDTFLVEKDEEPPSPEIKALIESGREFDKFNVLMMAVHQGRFADVKFLIEKVKDLYTSDSIKWDTFLKAASDGHVKILDYFLQKEPGLIKCSNNYGYTALRFAVLKNQLKAVEFLVNKGADIDRNAFVDAVLTNKTDIVKFFIENGAVIEEETVKQVAFVGAYQMVKYLLEQKPEFKSSLELIDWKSKDNKTPLMIALMNDDLEGVKFFAENGANIDNDIFTEAYENRDIKFIKCFIEQDSTLIEFRDRSGNTPLSKAISTNDLELARILVKQGLTITGETAIEAIQSGANDVAKFFINENSWLINFKVRYYNAPLRTAARHKNLEMVNFLVEKGASIDRFVLSSAARSGSIDVVKLVAEFLINKDPKLVGYACEALAKAAESGNLEVVKFFVEKGAMITPREINAAARSGSVDVVKFLINERPEMIVYANEALLEAVRSRSNEVAKFLINEAPRLINYKYDDGKTLLQMAIEHGNSELVKILIENEIHTDYAKLLDIVMEKYSKSDNSWESFRAGVLDVLLKSKDKSGNTALMFAAGSGNYNAVEFLVKNKADISTQNELGETALDIAMKRTCNDQIVSFLEDRIRPKY